MACYIRGILEDDGEWNEAIQEAYHWASGPKMRVLFLTILLFCDVSNIKEFWEINWSKLCEDILPTRRRILRIPLLTLTEHELKNLTLAELQKILMRNGRSLEDIEGMPLPDQKLLHQLKNRLILEEQRYDIRQLQMEHETLKNSLNEDQLKVYEKVISSVENKCSKLFFLYGYGGTRKTFLYKAIISKLRSDSKIVLAVASSGIDALLLPGGRTAHSRFRIPLNVKEDSTCTIKQGTQMAKLIRKASLVICDDAPMDAKHAFEAIDKTFKDILRGTESYSSDKPFGGKIVLLGGDFRQILPVIPGGSRGDIVNASLNCSYLLGSIAPLRANGNWWTSVCSWVYNRVYRKKGLSLVVFSEAFVGVDHAPRKFDTYVDFLRPDVTIVAEYWRPTGLLDKTFGFL